GPSPLRALRRRGPARGHRTRAGHGAATDPGRRADGQPRQRDGGGDRAPARRPAPRRAHGGPGDAQRRAGPPRAASREAARRPGGDGGMNASPRVLLRLGVRSLLVHKLRSVLSILGVVFGVAAVTAEAGGRTTDAGVVGTTAGYRDAARLRLSAGRFLTDLDVEDRKRVAVLGASIANTLFPFEAPVGQRLVLGGDWYDIVGVVEGRAVSRARTGPIRSRDVNRAVFVPLPALDRGTDSRADGIDEIVLRIDDSERVGASAE